MQPGQPSAARLVRPSAVPVFLLSGGLGTRLSRIESRPKAVVPVAGLPFLAYLLRLLRIQGFRHFQLLLGHGADEILAALGAESVVAAFAGVRPSLTGGQVGSSLERRLHDADIDWIREEEMLGTGGALAQVRDRAARWNLVLNADSYAEVLYHALLLEHAHHDQEGHAVTLLAVWQDDRTDYGGLEVDREGRILTFLEKGSSGPGWINGGAYVAGERFFRELPAGRFSLEREVLPDLARRGRLRASRMRCFFRDIGTPERLAQAQHEFLRIHRRLTASPDRSQGVVPKRGTSPIPTTARPKSQECGPSAGNGEERT